MNMARKGLTGIASTEDPQHPLVLVHICPPPPYGTAQQDQKHYAKESTTPPSPAPRLPLGAPFDLPTGSAAPNSKEHP